MREYGLQLYSIRNAITENYHDALRQVAEMGYKMAELYGGMGPGAQTLRSWMDEFGLRVSGTHTKAADLAPDMLSQTIADHHTLGCDTLIIPHYDISTAEKVDELVNLINTVQPVLEKEGITLAFHNHSREFWPNEAGQLTHFELQKRTDIKFELDTFWTMRAAVNPVDQMKKMGSRIKLIHQKDFAWDSMAPLNTIGLTAEEREMSGEVGMDGNSSYAQKGGRMSQESIDEARRIRNTAFTEIGTGIMHIQEIIDAANAYTDAKYIILEQDYTRMESQLASVEKSMEAFRKFSGISWDAE